MDYAGFTNSGALSAGFINNLESTNNGIILLPNPLGGQDISGTISLAVDLKASGSNFALGTSNWTTSNPLGADNLVIGNESQLNLVGNDNIAIGRQNMENLVSGSVSNNIALGSGIMQRMADVNNHNIGIGSEIGPEVGSDNILLGRNVGYYLVGSNNIIEGKDICSGNATVGSNNIILSNGVFTQASSEVETTILIGGNSMNAALLSNEDIIIGTQNLQQMGNSSNNLIIGHNNLQNATIAGNSNIYLGRRLNQNVAESIDNILIGRDIEFTSNDKRNCIVIGQNIQLPAETGDNTTIIGGSKVAFNGIVNPIYNHENYDTLAVRPQSSLYNYPFVIDTFSGLTQFTGDTSTQTVYYRDLNNLRNGNSTQVLNIRLSFTCVYTTTTDVATYFFTMSHALPMVYTGGQWLFSNPLVPSAVPYNQNTANNGYTVSSSNTTGNIVGGITGGYYTINSGELIYFATQTANIYSAPCNYSVTMLVDGVGF